MKTLIYTPLYKKHQLVPHIVEHCVGKQYPFSDKRFFENKIFFSKEITGEITTIISDIGISIGNIINVLTQNLSLDVYNFEKKILKEEIKNMHQGGLIYEAMIQKIVDDEIQLNQRKTFDFNTIKQYHEKYYVKENFLIFDDNVNQNDEFKIEFVGKNILEKFQCLVGKNKKFFQEFYFDESKFYIIGYKGLNFIGYWQLVFSRIILDTYCTYYMRYIKGKYFYESVTFDYFDEYIWLTIPQIDYTGLTKSFFNESKKYIKSILKSGSFKERICLSQIIFGVKNTRSEIINLCGDFSRECFSNFMDIVNQKK